ncbi:hypothetical protein MNBD_UNCLBAC01-158 [hydrothermal vent metagenome]|uniref:Type II secretion system protein GspC N-terminal domain-containing protein n=1 Tax=hydrothermal vent metagenome TaxID=652676 RepID=A0A3B1DLP8_9ZZZZ
MFFSLPVFSADEVKEKKFIYADHGKRDPFWSLVSSTGIVVNYGLDLSISDLVLEGTVEGDKKQSFAIISGRIVKLNDRIGQFMVLKIEKDSVTLKGNQQTFDLKLKRSDDF